MKATELHTKDAEASWQVILINIRLTSLCFNCKLRTEYIEDDIVHIKSLRTPSHFPIPLVSYRTSTLFLLRNLILHLGSTSVTADFVLKVSGASSRSIDWCDAQVGVSRSSNMEKVRVCIAVVISTWKLGH